MFSSHIMLASLSTRYLPVYFHTTDEAFGWWRCVVVRVTVSLGFELASLTGFWFGAYVLRGFTLWVFLLQGCYEWWGNVCASTAFPWSIGDLGIWVYTGLYIHSYFRVPIVVFDHAHRFRVCMLLDCLFQVEYRLFYFFQAQAPSYSLFNSSDPTGWLQRLCLPAL